jgi:hypothetical protein
MPPLANVGILAEQGGALSGATFFCMPSSVQEIFVGGWAAQQTQK